MKTGPIDVRSQIREQSYLSRFINAKPTPLSSGHRGNIRRVTVVKLSQIALGAHDISDSATVVGVAFPLLPRPLPHATLQSPKSRSIVFIDSIVSRIGLWQVSVSENPCCPGLSGLARK